MKVPFTQELLPRDGLLLLCASHESRCLGVLRDCVDWAPKMTVLFRYDEDRPTGDLHGAALLSTLQPRSPVTELSLSQISEASSESRRFLSILAEHGNSPIIVDISVMSKRILSFCCNCSTIEDSGIVYGSFTVSQKTTRSKVDYRFRSVCHP